MSVSDHEIADRLNELAYTRRAAVVSRRFGVGELYGVEDNPDLFPGHVLLDCKRLDGRPWTADLVAAELRRA